MMNEKLHQCVELLLFYLSFQNGESDCWPMPCPPTFCSHPVLVPGSCCPTCINLVYDECPDTNSSIPAANSTTCFYSGSFYRNGESWPVVESGGGDDGQPSRGGCTSCKCKVSRIVSI